MPANRLRTTLRDVLRGHPSLKLAAQELPPLRALSDGASAIGAWRFARGPMVPHTLGYASYKTRAIRRGLADPEVLRRFRTGQLPPGYGYRLDERIVEYPWALSQIQDGTRRILDAGSTFNFPHILNADVLEGRSITILTLDREGFVASRQAVSYVYDDIRCLPFRDGHFDTVVCLSTLEHVGLDNSLYTTDPTKRENDAASYLAAVRELVRVAKPGGRILLSMPYGTHKNWGWFQTFDEEMVRSIRDLVAPRRMTETYFKYADDQWQFSTAAACRDCECFVPGLSDQPPPDFLAFSRGIVGLCIEK
ncbi:MAG: hypothetical protein QOG89_167 [Thermomicrobiales bacterium]|nr:hypothetical protein [Thermomicrobiales bacterium]